MNYLYFIIGFIFALAIGPSLIDINGTIKSILISILVIILTIFLWPIWLILAIILVLLNEFEIQ